MHFYLTSLVAHCLSQHLHIFKLRPICLHCHRNVHGAGLTIHCILQCKVWSHSLLGAGSELRALILQGLLAHCPSLWPSHTRSHVVGDKLAYLSTDEACGLLPAGCWKGAHPPSV